MCGSRCAEHIVVYGSFEASDRFQVELAEICNVEAIIIVVNQELRNDRRTTSCSNTSGLLRLRLSQGGLSGGEELAGILNPFASVISNDFTGISNLVALLLDDLGSGIKQSSLWFRSQCCFLRAES